MVGLLLAILALFVATGIPAIDAARLRPVAPFGTKAILPTVALLFVSYIGVTKVASVGEEVRNPERNIPLGMILSLCVVTVLYALVVWVVVGVVPAGQLHSSLTPLHDAGRRTIGVGGTREKDVTLAIGRQLADRLRRESDIEVVLTRNRDTLVSFVDRPRASQLHGGDEMPDLFISIHANSMPRKPHSARVLAQRHLQSFVGPGYGEEVCLETACGMRFAGH